MPTVTLFRSASFSVGGRRAQFGRESGKGVSTVSESDKNDDEAVAPQQQASGEPEKRSINDPLTRKGVESPRVPWQSQGSSPQTEKREGDEAGGDAESGN
jgi:hypothetical protein